jgi:adapter protein MecA 1/2
VRADIMPDHTISLTFSEHPGTEGVMDHIKDIVNGLLNTIPKQKWDEIKAMKDKDAQGASNGVTSEEQLRVIVLFAFEDLDTLMRYAKQVKVEQMPFNQLYKFDGIYFLMMDMTDGNEADVRKLSALTDEYAADIFVGAEKRAFIYEHGKEIIKERAIEQLSTI